MQRNNEKKEQYWMTGQRVKILYKIIIYYI